MLITLEGNIKEIFPEKKLNDKVIVKDFLLTTDPDSHYAQNIVIGALNDKIALVSKCHVGQKVKVKCNLKGREKDGRYFNVLNVFDITNG